MAQTTNRPGTAPPEPPTAAGPPPPLIALRTYMFLRLAMVAVIAALAIAIAREYAVAGDCLQGSVSAYYYTRVHAVFIGALVTLGVGMIVLWGKTSTEDAFLNLAGMLAPVVAFVPTARTNLCGLTAPPGAGLRAGARPGSVVTARDARQLVEQSRGAVFDNMLTMFVVVGVVLLVLLGVAITALTTGRPRVVVTQPRAFWFPWATGTALYLVGGATFVWARGAFYAHAHTVSAITMFVFVAAFVVAAGAEKWRDAGSRRKLLPVGWLPVGRWAWTYWTIAILMAVGAAAVAAAARWLWTGDFLRHRPFLIEAWETGCLFVFWCLQTWDRRNEGAPRRADQATTPPAARHRVPA